MDSRITSFPPLILFASQRSGTTAFRRALQGTELFYDAEEIFNAHFGARSPKTFPYFCSVNAIERELVLFPTDMKLLRAFRRYLTYIYRNMGKPRIPILDIKIGHIRYLSPDYREPDAPPYIFDIIKELGCRTAYLRRRNLLNQAISMLYALNKKVSGVTLKKTIGDNTMVATLPEGAIHLNPEKILDIMRLLHKQNLWMEENIKEKNIKIDHYLYYEDLYKDIGFVSGERLNLIFDQYNLQRPNADRIQQATLKMIKSPQDSIINYAEILSEVHNSEFSPFLATQWADTYRDMVT